jgi:hypothetical protein
MAMGNSGDKKFMPTLTTLCEDPDLVVAEHARWALGRLELCCRQREGLDPSGGGL